MRQRSADVKLAWPGRARSWGVGEGPLPKMTCDEVIPGAGSPVRVIRGDALAVARGLAGEGLAGKVDLVYLDPPFASERSWAVEARLDGPADGRVRRHVAYEDKLDTGAYLDMLAPCLRAMSALLAPTGTIWVHLDWRSAYLVRVLLDEILGRPAFLNEIVWRRAPNLGRQAASQQFGRTLDTIVVYGAPGRSPSDRTRAVLTPPTRLEPIEPSAIRWDDAGRPFTSAPRGDYTDASIARLEAEGRVHRTASGKAYVKYFLVKNGDGEWCRERRVDALWTDVPPLRHAAPAERTGFPTQKPRALLDRIVACATRPGGLVVDLFSGSGTTAESAHALGRSAIVGDAGDVGIATTRARLARAGAEVSLEQCEGAPAAEGSAVSIEVRRTIDPPRLRVRLLEPGEPLAWAIDLAPRPGAPFQASWHSERVPGLRAQPAAREAVVRIPEGGALGIRVYSDDGALSSRVLSPSELP